MADVDLSDCEKWRLADIQQGLAAQDPSLERMLAQHRDTDPPWWEFIVVGAAVFVGGGITLVGALISIPPLVAAGLTMAIAGVVATPLVLLRWFSRM